MGRCCCVVMGMCEEGLFELGWVGFVLWLLLLLFFFLSLSLFLLREVDGMNGQRGEGRKEGRGFFCMYVCMYACVVLVT